MEFIRIAIVTDDRAYGEALGRALMLENRNFDLGLYGCADFSGRWRERGEGFRDEYDLILWDSEGLARVYGGNLIWLTERRSETRMEPGSTAVSGGGARPGTEMWQRHQAGPGAPGSAAASSQNARPGPNAPSFASGVEQMRFALYKYDTGQTLAREIFTIYEMLTGRKPAGARPDRVDVFAFVSWQGGCGCTSVAMAVARELSRYYGKKVLYLSMEGTESTARFMGQQAATTPTGSKTMGEYLYHLAGSLTDTLTDTLTGSDKPSAGVSENGRPGQTPGGRCTGAGATGGGRSISEIPGGQRTGSAGPFLEPYLVRDGFGVMAFAPTGSCNPLGMAGQEEIQMLMPALMESGRFDVIVVDGGCGVGEGHREMLAFADRVCAVTSREEPAREEGYRNYLRYGAQVPAERLIWVRNRCTQPASRAWVHISEAEHPNSTTLLEGTFARDIHNLTELCYNGVATASEAS